MDVETIAHPQQLQSAPGRGDRVARTREAIVGSALALAIAGEVAPIVRDIAKVATELTRAMEPTKPRHAALATAAAV